MFRILRVSFVRALVRQTGLFVAWLPVLIFVHDHCVSIGMVQGVSMQPTLNPDANGLWNDWVLLKRWGIHRQDGTLAIERGQVVMLSASFWCVLNIHDELWCFNAQNNLRDENTSPVEPKTYLAKRVLALEGDIVETRSRVPTRIKVPKGYVWIEGDEGFRSRDSNTYGVIPTALIDAKITHIIWPWWRIGRVDQSSGKHLRVWPQTAKDSCVTSE
ncbi:hypothetical protein PORY_000248 [Pneumocystis oryctolagi]|uniref:Uncharacterized protein n=1 Tax=Pneumocystis oryctolagi TaxID=42067 RepID=A0ACB7CFF8_9ASCO|nr:hypothetical protein PORY_000248 [Pneumocystis oryctolagi]